MDNNDQTVAELITKLVQRISETSAERAIQKYSQLQKAVVPKTLWNKKQTFKYLRICHDTGNKWIKQGYLKPLNFNGRLKFDPEEIIVNAREMKSHKYERN